MRYKYFDQLVDEGVARFNALGSRSKSPADVVCDPSSRPLPRSMVGQRVRLHLNLHNGCYAVTVAGRVVGYTRAALLHDVTSKVSRSGYESCRDEHVRNVHAYLEGTLADAGDHLASARPGARMRRVSYNCLKGPPCFYYVDDRQCLVGAAEALALPHGRVWVS